MRTNKLAKQMSREVQGTIELFVLGHMKQERDAALSGRDTRWICEDRARHVAYVQGQMWMMRHMGMMDYDEYGAIMDAVHELAWNTRSDGLPRQ